MTFRGALRKSTQAHQRRLLLVGATLPSAEEHGMLLAPLAALRLAALFYQNRATSMITVGLLPLRRLSSFYAVRLGSVDQYPPQRPASPL